MSAFLTARHLVWSGWVVAALLVLGWLPPMAYGMGGAEMVFLIGLGLVYAIAFAITGNLMAIWPLLTPIGGFFATMSNGDITLPWIAIMGFLHVLGIMAALLWVVHKRERKAADHSGRRKHSAAGQSVMSSVHSTPATRFAVWGTGRELDEGDGEPGRRRSPRVRYTADDRLARQWASPRPPTR